MQVWCVGWVWLHFVLLRSASRRRTPARCPTFFELVVYYDCMATERSMNAAINEAFLRFLKRAENESRDKLVETFVDIGALATLLKSPDHQILYGRRGTGKTHALTYLGTDSSRRGDLPVYIDLRQIGSNQSIYGDGTLDISERATRLLVDVLQALHDGLLEVVLDHPAIDLSSVSGPLDRLQEAATEVEVIGTSETEREQTVSKKTGFAGKLRLKSSSVPLEASASAEKGKSSTVTERKTETGRYRYHIRFGSVGAEVQSLVKSLKGERIWILLDEWSSIPSDLQPLLADLIRRTILPCRGVTVKIGAIEQRSVFQGPSSNTDYIGIEVGADASADLNLDDFMVFDNDSSKAVEFFEELIFRHYRQVQIDEGAESGYPEFTSAKKLIGAAFTQVTSVQEFVRAAEGVPRDAINILSLAAQKAGDDPISTPHVRAAAQTWYRRDKEKAVSATQDAFELLNWIIEEVIAHRRARAFLVDSIARNKQVDQLFDSRVLHILKKNISSPEEPGARYNVYKIDYGCYVDLLSTNRAPEGLLPYHSSDTDDKKSYVDVPPDDYRAIRRAILNIEMFKPSSAEEDG